ncbi:hypothetical protein [Duganella vulcania]|uniref:Uncharacterized protein n=1 Tax=Duganella vulcania TaxID=2692166 RepID=A0A845GF60_9BURK|nr:hypothetical protein [Duganella vulcania]MYM92561.1 hypothetical protein [Duganella vulcania]
MSKNCYSCEHIENNGSNEPGEVSGWVCANPKREPQTIEEERNFDKNWASEDYRKRYKRCYQAPASNCSEIVRVDPEEACGSRR